MSKFLKVHMVLIGLWLILTFGVFVFPHNIHYAGSWGVIDILFSFSLLIVVIVYIVFYKGKSKAQATIAIYLVTVITWLLWSYQLQYGARMHFYFHNKEYEEIVKRLSVTTIESERNAICENKCVILNNEPLKVSFRYAQQGVNTVKDIVYDPTSSIPNMKNEIILDKDTQIDIQFVGADHLKDEWYLAHLEFMIN